MCHVKEIVYDVRITNQILSNTASRLFAGPNLASVSFPHLGYDLPLSTTYKQTVYTKVDTAMP